MATNTEIIASLAKPRPLPLNETDKEQLKKLSVEEREKLFIYIDQLITHYEAIPDPGQLELMLAAMKKAYKEFLNG